MNFPQIVNVIYDTVSDKNAKVVAVIEGDEAAILKIKSMGKLQDRYFCGI